MPSAVLPTLNGFNFHQDQGAQRKRGLEGEKQRGCALVAAVSRNQLHPRPTPGIWSCRGLGPKWLIPTGCHWPHPVMPTLQALSTLGTGVGRGKKGRGPQNKALDDSWRATVLDPSGGTVSFPSPHLSVESSAGRR